MLKYVIINVFFLSGVLAGAQQSVRINEFSSNVTAGHDWIELYNPTSESVNLKGWHLSDDGQDPDRWEFPSVKIRSGGFLVVYASGLNYRKKREYHTNFKLRSSGEPIILSDPKGRLADKCQPKSCGPDMSYGRSSDGSDNFEWFRTPTPGSSNMKSSGILFSHQSGIYNQSFELSLKSRTGDTIYFTLDGSVPNQESAYYHQPIITNSGMGRPDIATDLAFTEGSRPRNDLFKGFIIRAATFRNGRQTSPVYTKTFFILPGLSDRYKQFNIVSLVTDLNNLFHKDSGLYTNGGKDLYNANFNQRGKLWERSAYITCFNETGEILFDQDIGIRIHGQTTRKYPSKSFRIYTHSRYGPPEINTSAFTDSRVNIYRKLILRNSMGDPQKTIFKNELTTTICNDLSVDSGDNLPCILFINGEYWGIYSLHEYLGADYISEKYQVDRDSVNIVFHGTGNYNGPDPKYKRYRGHKEKTSQLYAFLRSADLNQPMHYEKLNAMLNVQSIIDFYCIQLFFGNTDYLNNNNKLWSIGKNGQWDQFLFDMDWAWMDAKANTLSPLLDSKSSARHPVYATYMFRTLIQSKKFRVAFINRMGCLLKSKFKTKNLIASIEAFRTFYKPVIREHLERWRRPGSVYQWEQKVNQLIGFAKLRPQYIIKHFSSAFKIDFDPESCNCQ